MTDYAFYASSKEDMYAAYAQVGVLTLEGDVRQGGAFADGGGWALNDWGMVDGSYWCVLRWNGADPTPLLPDNITVAWRSDAEDPGEYPAGVTRFA